MVAVVPGRVRLRFPALRGHGDAASVAEAFLATLPGVRSARAYRRKGSLVVSFDPEVVGAIDDLVEAITARLPAGTAPASASVVAVPRGGAPSNERGEIARLVVGGVVLLGVAIRRWVLRRGTMLSARGRTIATVVTIITGYPFFKGASSSAAAAIRAPTPW